MAEIEANHAVKIAVLQEQISGLRQQQRAHNEVAQQRFNALENKIDELTAIMNRGRGAYAASMALAAGIGALLIQVVSVLTSYFHK
jgi:hypothetical protein